jgi:hypothetical protein
MVTAAVLPRAGGAERDEAGRQQGRMAHGAYLGIVTYVWLMSGLALSTIWATTLPVSAQLSPPPAICYIGAVVSAFASTTGILGALIPLAVPFC